METKQKEILESYYNDATLAPIFKKNPKYCVNEFADLIPFIAYDDIMNYSFIIRGTQSIDNKSETNPVIVEYKSIDEIINDGWRLE